MPQPHDIEAPDGRGAGASGADHNDATHRPPRAAVDGSGLGIGSPIRLARCAITGILMGLANLVPGVSGGTMVLIMGLYDEFISSVADITRFKFSRRNVVFLGLLGGAAVVTVASLAGPMRGLVVSQRTAMYALFIGMTLGGVPSLWRMTRPLRGGAAVGALLGIALMVAIAASGRSTHPSRHGGAAASVPEVIEVSYGRDAAAGVLGMSAMVLPGISGAYMLLIIGRYEAILGAVALLKESALSGSAAGRTEALGVIVPVALGAILGLVVVSNLLKWLLRRFPKQTSAVLLGILLGSVEGLWPFDASSGMGDYVVAGVVYSVGFSVTAGLARIGGRRGTNARY